MPINLELTIDNASAHKNGIVGYDFSKIYQNYPAEYEKNGDRVKSIFDTSSFIDVPARDVALGQHIHKSELDKFGNSDVLATRIAEITANEKTPLVEALEAVDDADDGADAQIAALQLQIDEIDAKITKIQSQYAAGFLLDTTINAVTDVEGNDLDYDVGSDSAYNPDFPVQTMSYAYNKDVYAASQRGVNVDGVVAGTKAPNVSYPKNEDSTYISPKAGNGGFGVHPSINSNNEGVLTSLQVTARYQ